jgi:kinesin family protein 1
VLDVSSPYTQSVVGIVKLTIEPSEGESRSTLKFNVIMRDMAGFAEREGTQVHAQMFISGVSDESGATTTTMVSNFDEGPIHFNSVHSMSMPLGGPLRNATLRVAIFAKVTAMHLEKLISWDDMRDQSYSVSPRKKKSARINETEFYTEERHDVFARAQILELSETGEYLPVEVVQQTEVDQGAFQLHQGLQRRIQISLTHSSGETLQWQDIRDIRIGSVRLLDPRGKTPDLSSPTKEVRLNTILGPVVKTNADGTSTVTVVAQWDSSLHNSILLDRTTADKYRVHMCLRWNVMSERLSDPILFSLDIAAQIQPRLNRGPSKFMQLWNSNRIVHANVGLYQLVIRPAAARRAGDLWRMNTIHRYVKGEEYLAGWTPRGVSLVRDFITAKRRRTRVAEVENAKGFLSSLPVTRNATPTGRDPLQQISYPTQERSQPDSDNGETGNDQPVQQVDASLEMLNEMLNGGGWASQAGVESEGRPESIPLPDQTASERGILLGAMTEYQLATLTETPEVYSLRWETPKSPPDDPQIRTLRKFVELWSSWKDPSEVCFYLRSRLFLSY